MTDQFLTDPSQENAPKPQGAWGPTLPTRSVQPGPQPDDSGATAARTIAPTGSRSAASSAVVGTTSSFNDDVAMPCRATGPSDEPDPAWWWAVPETVPYKAHRLPGTYEQGTDPTTLHPMLTDAFFERVRREVSGWLERPLVWRDDGHTVQVLLLGTLRYTWSRSRPQGLLETFHLNDGWRIVDPGAQWHLQRISLFTFNEDLTFFPYAQLLSSLLHAPNEVQHFLLLVLNMVGVVLQQTARDLQRQSARRLTQWVDSMGFARSWVPFQGPGMELPSEAVAPLLHRALPDELRHQWLNDTTLIRQVSGRVTMGLKRLGRLLIARSPLWAVVRRQSAWPKVRPSLSDLHQLFARMDDWEARLSEQPNAGALLPLLPGLLLAPDVHLWREDVWVPFVLPSPHSWRFALRQCPAINLRTFLHHGDLDGDARSQMRRLAMLSEIPEAQQPLPTAVLRAVPVELWKRSGPETEESQADVDARDAWVLSLIRAFFAAAHTRPWVDQRVSLPDWLSTVQPVWAWARQQRRCPFDDPSWTWTTVMERFLHDPTTNQPDWSSLLRPGRLGKGTITPINSHAQWFTMGLLMKNCLKDQRSDDYREAASNGQGLLYHLDLNGHSSVLFMVRSPAGWSIVEHRGMANSFARDDHQQMARTIVCFHNAEAPVPPVRSAGGWLFGWRRRQGSDGAQDRVLHELLPADLEDLRALVDPAWSNAHQRQQRRWLNPLRWADHWFEPWQNGMAPRSWRSRWTHVLVLGVLGFGVTGLLSMLVSALGTFLGR